tara:strand:- start:1117 stop:1713 length:597 start_codon:yes stop_codon:yes gene_type:complete
MVNYESVIFDEEPVEITYEPREEVDIAEEIITKKKKLSQKQLDALAKGRARVAENRKKKIAELNRDKLAEEKKNKKFVDDGIKLIKDQKENKSKILRTQKEKQIYEKLMAKKELELAKEAEKKQPEPEPVPEPEDETITDEFKIENFYSLREEFLGKCETLEDFEEMSSHLDTITDDDIVDDEKLLNKLNNILVNYNE